MFHNLISDPAVFAANVTAGAEMRAWIRGFLSQREPWPQADGDDTVSRLLKLAGSGLAGFDTERVVTNVAGLLVGAIETASQAIVNATEQILLRPEIKARAIEAAALDDPEEFNSIVWEALRFNPMTALVQRIAAEETVLAPASDYATTVPAGRVVAVGIGSAMFDPALFADPDEFKARDRLAYLHMGFGQHICLGQYVGYAMIPETVRQIMRLRGIHLLENNGSKVDDLGGPFAERFVLGVTPAPADA